MAAGVATTLATPAAVAAASCIPGLGISELEIVKRLLAATFAGAAIGFERRYSERPAGLRTMALVSLGAAIFTILSLALPGDKSRMAASVASGVGFIGAGVISQNGFEDGKAGGRRCVHTGRRCVRVGVWGCGYVLLLAGLFFYLDGRCSAGSSSIVSLTPFPFCASPTATNFHSTPHTHVNPPLPTGSSR